MANRTTVWGQMLRMAAAAATTVLSVWTGAAPNDAAAAVSASPAEAAKPAAPLLSSDNYLSALTFDQGVLVPAFISTTQEYTLSGLPYVSQVGVTYTANSPVVMMVLSNGCYGDMLTCELVESDTTIATFDVYAEDSSMRTYTVTIQRAVGVPAVPLVAPVTKLSHGASAEHRCAVLKSGSLLCWGNNQYGQLGLGDTTNRYTPVTVTGVTDAVDVAVGNGHTCILRSDGTVQCVGRNNNGQLGDGTLITQTTPVNVLNPEGTGPLTGVTHLSAGGNSTCATVNAKVWCWGRDVGLSGWDGSEDVLISNTLPLTVSGVSDVADVVVGSAHACALTNAGKVQCWGRTSEGQLGNGVTANSPSVSVPVTMKNAAGTADLTGVTAVRAGLESTCVVMANTQQMCVGDNDYYQTADGTQNDSNLPVAATLTGTVTAMTGISQTAPGDYHGCVLSASGFVYCAAEGYYGVLGVGMNYPQIRAKRLLTVTTSLGGPPLSGVLEIVSISNNICARTATAVFCWGEGRKGAVGNGLFEAALSPAAVISIPSGSQSSDASIAALTMDAPAVLQGTWVSSTTRYTVNVPAGETGVMFALTPSVTSTLNINGDSSAGGCDVSYSQGEEGGNGGCTIYPSETTFITLTVAAEDGTTRDYYLVVMPTPPSSDASIASLTMDAPAALESAWVSSTLRHTATVPAGANAVMFSFTPTVTSLQNVTGDSSGGGCDVSYSTGEESGIGGCNIAASGATYITLTVTAEDGTTRDYVIVVTAQPYATSLAIDIPGLTPAFVSTTLNYQTEVPSGTNVLVVTPTLSAGATAAYSSTAGACTVNGANRGVASGAAAESATCPLFPTQTTTVTVDVTDGTTTRSYVIRATRAAAPDSTRKFWFPLVPAVQ